MRLGRGMCFEPRPGGDGGADETSALAFATERMIWPGAAPIGDAEEIGHAKVLLMRQLPASKSAGASVFLQPLTSDDDWHHYTGERIAVESSFGVTEQRARAMVTELRDRAGRLEMTLFFACIDAERIGAICFFRLPAPWQSWARLQEVDVFPTWRGRGYGTAMLIEMLHHLHDAGCTVAAIGADEDDWPLDWYRRHGFTDVMRVTPSGVSAS